MARFTLVVRPDGSALLTTPTPMSPSDRVLARTAINTWLADGAGAVLIVHDCDVVQVRDVEIDLPEIPEEVPA